VTAGHAAPRPRLRDRGQATVELALGLPLVCLMLLGVLQVALVVRHQLAVHAAARDGARAAAASADPGAAGAAALATTGLRPLTVTTSEHHGRVTVTVTYVDHTDAPLIGALLPDVTLTAEVTMVIEPP